MIELSVILASHNYARFLPDALRAVANQLDERMEFLIIDDASTDESPSIIAEFAKSTPRTHVFLNRENQGIHAATAQGLKAAAGKYVLFAAADDRILPGLLPRSLDMLTRHPEAAFCTAPVRYVDAGGNSVMPWSGPTMEDGYASREKTGRLMRRHGFWFVAATTVFNLGLLQAAGGYDPALGHLSDSFVAQTLALRHGFCMLEQPLAEVRILTESYSGTGRADLEDTYKIRLTATQRMSQTPDLYPEAFIREWNEAWGFLDAFQSWSRKIRRPQQAFLGEQIALFRPHRAWTDRIFPALIGALGSLQFLLLALWGLCVLYRNPLLHPYLAPKRCWNWLLRQISRPVKCRSKHHPG